MFYRIHQFYHGLFPQITLEDLRLVRSFLSGSAVSLFQAQSPADQRHALDVAKDLLENAARLSPSSQSDLIQAALLHDCGKIRVPLKIWQRGYIVICTHLPHGFQKWLQGLTQYPALSLPLILAQHHPQWGALLAAQAGLNGDVVTLIREHHAPRSEAGKLLSVADNRH